MVSRYNVSLFVDQFEFNKIGDDKMFNFFVFYK